MSPQAKDEETLSEFYRNQVTEQDAGMTFILLPIADDRANGKTESSRILPGKMRHNSSWPRVLAESGEQIFVHFFCSPDSSPLL